MLAIVLLNIWNLAILYCLLPLLASTIYIIFAQDSFAMDEDAASPVSGPSGTVPPDDSDAIVFSEHAPTEQQVRSIIELNAM